MALTDVALCSRALVRLGATPISSFTQGTAESDVASHLYAPVRDALLSAYPWTFAMAQVPLIKSNTPPAADYASSFILPPDYLRAVSAGNGGRGRGLHYRITQGRLHTQADAVTLTYIFRPNELDFPPYFDMALMARLAAEFCIPLTENTSRADILHRLAESELARARQIDSQQDSPGRIENFTLIDIRQ